MFCVTWSGRSKIWCWAVDIIRNNFRTGNMIWEFACCSFCLWQQCYFIRVLFCCSFLNLIKMEVIENIPVNGMEVGSSKATSCSFSCLRLQICITKQFTCFVMFYHMLNMELPLSLFLLHSSASLLQWLPCPVAGACVHSEVANRE